MLLSALVFAATLSPFDQVVEAERAFAAASVRDGQHEAFLAHLADTAITFDPLPTPARPHHEGKPHASTVLTWGPSWVAVSSSGDLAFSSGPWQILGPDSNKIKSLTGWFFSVWRLQPGGDWKVVVDSGGAMKMLFTLPTSVENGLPAAPAKNVKPNDAANARLAMTTAERALATAAKRGIGSALAAAAEPGVRLYRQNEDVAVGPAAKAVLDGERQKMSCAAEQITASASGDVGYAYGTCTEALGAGGSDSKLGFLHVWRKQADGTYKLFIDVAP